MRLRLIRLDEGGVKKGRESSNLRLVCLIEGGGKVALWGSTGSQGNIDRVLAVGMPCEIECDCIAPGAWAVRYGHTYWVPQGNKLAILGK